ncbi:hypothetical protein ACFWR9_11180 [Streptomyces sp. NPDC058534]|uniref:hypothetical protein n=1 Tax=Streptomyces sp. NPDC058534 TaxID=3346541 RepID=UPI00366241F2
MNILREMLADDGDTHDNNDSSPPPQAAVAHGNDPAPDPAGRHPIRRKRHLGLFLGGVAAAMATFSGVAREIAATHRIQLVGTVTGAAVAAATVTVITVQPWTDSTDYEPPSAAPSASAPPTPAPPGTQPPPTPAPPTRGASPSTAAQDSSGSPSPSPTRGSPSPRASPESTDVPIVQAGDEPSATAASPAASDGVPGNTGGTSGESPPTGSPGPSPEQPRPPVDPPTEPPPVAEESADSGLCLDLSLVPLLDADACLLG